MNAAVQADSKAIIRDNSADTQKFLSNLTNSRSSEATVKPISFYHNQKIPSQALRAIYSRTGP